MDLKPEMTCASFAVEVPVDTFLAITRHDKSTLMQKATLGDVLEKLPGVSDVEYNGHFGSFIYYTLEAPTFDHAPVLAAIESYSNDAR